MDMQFKTFPFEVKAANADGSMFEGMVSVFHNIDSYGEIVDDGAFDQDLPAFMASGFIGGLNHDWDNPIGTPQPGTAVTDAGLFLKGNVIDTQHGMDVRKMLKAGVVKKLSIGYQTLGDMMLADSEECMAYWESKGYTPNAQDMARCMNGARVLTRVKIYEGSPVTVAANDLATITAVKAAREAAEATYRSVAAETKGPTGNASLPLADRERAWDSSAADQRVRTWAGATDAPNAKYRSAFFWYDESAPENFGSYKLQFADVVDGGLKAIPRAIFACAGVMAGARGGVDIPEGDRAGVISRIKAYYRRMADEFDDPEMMPPDMMGGKSEERPEGTDRLQRIRAVETHSDAEEILRDAGFSRTESKALVSRFKTLLRDAEGEQQTPEPQPDVQNAPSEETGETPVVEEKREEPKGGEVAANLTPFSRIDPTSPYGVELLNAKRETGLRLHAKWLELNSRMERDKQLVAGSIK